MKKILLPIVLLFSVIGHAQFITVDESLTIQELVEDVLIDSPCAETSNYGSRTGIDFGDGNGIAAFDANGSGFPFQTGIVLSSGFVSNTPGPNLTTHSDGGLGWPGDADLELYTSTSNSNNASFIQFEFVPLISQISFNFIFASEEYNQNFECTFSDAFAFILIDLVTGTVQNLAVLPGTTIPIEATNIHPDVPGGCPAINEEYFDRYNFLPFNDENTAAIDLNGQTISLVAQGDVIPGNPYTIKMVIADDQDTALDSAVFLEGGSFNIGVDLGEDLTIIAGNAPCDGEPLEIGVDPDPTGQTTYQWFEWNTATLMFDLIVGENSNILIVTQSGIYQIETTFSGGCTAADDVLIEFAPQPIAVVPDDLVTCDEVPNDGLAIFDLTVSDAQIINGQANTFVEYYELEADAESGTNPILIPAAYLSIDPGYQIVFARLEENDFGCYDIVPLVLQVDKAPAITDPIEDYFLCDNDQDGIEVFDLTTMDAEILNTLVGVTLIYFNTQLDAENNTNPIATPGVYPSSGETIWVRAENSAGCLTVSFFELVLGLVPIYVEVPLFSQCDDAILDGFTEFDLNSQNATIIDGNTNLSVTYYATIADAEVPQNDLLLPHTNTINPETVFVRVEDNTTGCYGVFGMLLEVVAPPDIFDPTPLEYCDPDNDGFGEFMLTDADLEITGGVPTGNLEVTYHYLIEDAINGVLPLPSPYFNDVPFSQIVYVRLFDNATGCYSITTLELLVLDTPQIITPTDMVMCDDDGDGIVFFDLTLSETELLNGLDPALYTISYYEDINLTIAITNPGNYPNIPPSPQTIYILVEDIANECQSQTTLMLWVNLPPVLLAPSPLELCDDTEITGPDDETEPFDLESKTAEITGGDVNISITYHETQADADAGTNPLASPYINTANPQTIFIHGEFVDTTCMVSQGITLDLVVNPLPSPITPTPLEVCDIDNDGFEEFTLTDKDAEILGGEPGVSISYHETLLDADMGINPLASPYINITTPSQILYVRAEYTTPATGCYRLVSLELIVNPTPTIPADLEDLVACDSDQDGVEIFDLTQRADEIYGSQDPADFTLNYYTTQADALAGINAIANPTAFPNTTNPQTIWVRLVNDDTTCVSIGSFDLVLGGPPAFTEVSLFALCDDEIVDGFTEFDLNTQNAAIVAGDTNLSVTYYGTQADAEVPENPLAIPYTNTINPEIIYVRVEDNTTSCHGIFTMELQVIAPPAIFAPDALEFCDPDNDGFGEFMLTDADLQVTGGIPTGNLVVTYHYLIEDAINGVLPLPSPYFNDVPFSQTVHVRLLDQTTGCYSITTLELLVLDSPQIITPTDLVMCDDNGDGIVFFDLTQSETELLNGLDPALYTITYYEDIGLSNLISNPTAYSNIPPSPQTIYILVEDIANECQSQTTLMLWVNLSPILIAPTPLELCDDTEITGPDDETEPFDLESKTDEITGGDVNISITYHETQGDADAGTNPLASPYLNTINPQTIFIRGEYVDTACMASQGITLDLVVNPLPSPITPTPFEVCDIDNDGFEEFTLTDKDAEILGGEPGVTISYHETFLDADMGINPLASPYTNTITPSQIIYVRAEYTTPATGCYRLVPMELIVNPTPTIPDDLEDLIACDSDQDGVEIFDLTQRADDIYGSQDPADFTLNYYTTQADAEAGINAIANPAAFPNTTNPQTIWVRLVNDITTCISVGSFDLILGGPPVFVEVSLFALCDDEIADGFTEFDLNTQNATIVDGDTNLSVTYYGNEIDADLAENPLVIPYTNTINPEIIYARVEDNTTDCYGVFAMELLVTAAPAIFEPDALEFCDPDNDGFGEFILTDADLQVTGGIPPGNLVVTYHYLIEDAINGVLPLPSPYLNDVPFSQTVHVRLLDQSSGCYSITTLELLVLDSPQIITPSDMILCDDDGDGIEVFDLTLSETELLNGLDPALYTITYYEDIGLSNLIANPTAYSNIPPSPQTIYVVVEDIANECQSQTTLILWVNSSPILVAPTPLELCDDTEITGPDDETEPFDLESKTDEITGGDVNISITYHQTQGDADTGDNPLVSPYINVTNPQTIFIRAGDSNTSCVVSQGITLDLVVNPLPSPITPTPLEACDVNNDGFADFDLISKDDEIIGGEPGVGVSYYETYLDAEQGIFALTSPYTNIVTPLQTLYVRAEYVSPGTECFRIIELDLIVNPTPIIPLDMEDLVICDEDQDGFAVFDLTLKADEIYGSQDPVDFTLDYYTSQADAEGDVNAIANPTAFLNTSNPQTIWVGLEDNITNCIKVGFFDIRVEMGSAIFQPEPLSQCDNLGQENDGFALFDLTQKDDEITGNAPGMVVSYYEDQLDAQEGENPIDPDTAYENTSNPQVIWVGVTDVNTGCYQASVYLTLRVVANPSAQDPDPIVLCDVDSPGDGIEIFDLTIREAQILDGETWDVTYYEDYESAVDNLDAIAIPTGYPNISNPQTIYVRVTIDIADSDSCFEIVELEIVVDALPDVSGGVTDYTICEIDNDEMAIFDLTSKIDEILNGQDPLVYQVLFYESQAEADAMLNPIQDPEIYENLSNPQTIWVVISNMDSECFVSALSFDLIVEEGAIANTPLDPYSLCDNWNENDGIAEFDLSDPDLVNEILGGQSLIDYTLEFFGSLDNAETATNALPDLYVNTINPQVIYARVTNIATDCYAIAEVILKVEQLPILSLDSEYMLCVDGDGNPIPGDDGISPPTIDTGLDPSLYIFEWQVNGDVLLGEIGASLTVMQEGLYVVTATEIATGCSSDAETNVITSSPPLVYDVVVVSGAFAELHNILATVEDPPEGGLGTYEFQLDDGPFQDQGSFVNVEAGNHTVTIRDKNGCGSVTVDVGVIDYPRFMTPNEDGYHDTWNIIGIASGDPTAKIYIFDRYGKLLKQISPLGEGWDGTYNGNPLPSSDYWFRIEYKENGIQKEFKGHFSLKR